VTALRRILSRLRNSKASKLKLAHAEAAQQARSGGKGSQVAAHKSYALFHERLRRGV
jgi:hypothetical protein